MDSIPISWFCAFCLAISFISCFHEVYGRNSLPNKDILEENNYTHVKMVKKPPPGVSFGKYCSIPDIPQGPNILPSLKPVNGMNNSFKSWGMSQYGDIYDCVELYKQPALQHPLLHDHKIQIIPFSQQKKVSEKGASSNLRFGLKKECPPGTVPIRRTTKEEQFQAKAIHRQQFQGSKFSNGQENRFAGVSSTDNRKYKHAEGHLSTHNPNVGKGQLSASVISIESGQPDYMFGTIRVGWMVYPDLYNGDNHTRLYTSWGQFENNRVVKGCFNTYCPGFVQVNKKIPVDMVIDKISVPAGEYSYIKLGLKRLDDWWLTYGEDDEKIGYWPNDLFNSLKEGAEVVRWGGWVSSTTQNLPMMGSGLLGDLGSQFKDILAVNDLSNSLKGTGNGAQYQILQSQCYRAGFNFDGDSFWYGGNGGDLQHCPLN